DLLLLAAARLELAQHEVERGPEVLGALADLRRAVLVDHDDLRAVGELLLREDDADRGDPVEELVDLAHLRPHVPLELGREVGTAGVDFEVHDPSWRGMAGQNGFRRSLDEGIPSSSRYFATVRRAM